MAHDYTATNPVKKLPKSEKPSIVHREAAYFTNEELPRLFAAIPGGLYRVFFETALKTGMREGLLVALTWGDVDLVDAVISVTPQLHGRRTDHTEEQALAQGRYLCRRG